MDSEEGGQRMQQDMDRLEMRRRNSRSNLFWMNEMLRFGRSNVRGKYIVNDKTLNSIDVQWDLGMRVNSSLEVAKGMDSVKESIEHACLYWLVC